MAGGWRVGKSNPRMGCDVGLPAERRAANRGLMKCLPVCFLSGLAMAAVRAETVPSSGLELRWQPGMRYVQRLEIRQNGLLPGNDGPKSQHATIAADMILTIRRHPKPDWCFVGVTWGAFRIAGANGEDRFAYDSARPAAGSDASTTEAGNAVRAYLGREFVFQRDPEGRISATPEFDALLREITSQAPEAKGPVKAFFTKTNITQLLRLGTIPSTPEQPVDKGAAWPFTTRFSIPIIGDLAMEGTCSHNGAAKRGGAVCTEVPVTGRLRLLSSPQASLMGLKSAAGTVTGSVWFDEAIGWARESVTTWTVTATLGGIASAKDGSLQKVPLRQTTRLTLVRVERADG